MGTEAAAVKILVIEDSESVLSMIGMFFQKEGIEGTFVADGNDGYREAMSGRYDCLIIDWMLPGMDGVTICRKVREAGIEVPIIMLTAKTSEADQVTGLETGADDYVTKPFSPAALMARIRAVTRRYGIRTADSGEEGIIRTKHFRINEKTREAFLDGEPVPNLTPKEFDLLAQFARHPRQVFTREQLIESVWGYDFYGDDRTVDVHVKRLRGKTEKDGRQFFHTVWGVGYRFEEPEDGA
ncbi:response regulator transcription factor [Bhargavaea cecembensis]|uniref:response regulator transcription factor n=1 Tax=Bhargavaea cecembensis TaxID=394098 RepID=UPI0009E1D6E8|nr:response regulator transcription factor [Bhargavaea cecembensis]